tara:strand:- start:713 stop:1201 length:489 start_codon:yes stop_codon:yes gene_type:complete
MIFGNCNLKIPNLYPRTDGSSMGGYYFSVGVKKEFAKQCFEEELTEKLYNRFQNLGRKMLTKVFGSDGHLPLFDSKNPYRFFKNSQAKETCLISNLVVPGNACGLDNDLFANIEKELNEIDKYRNFIEYHPHNIDSPRQCYAFLSLLTSWEDIMDMNLNPIK